MKPNQPDSLKHNLIEYQEISTQEATNQANQKVCLTYCPQALGRNERRKKREEERA